MVKTLPSGDRVIFRETRLVACPLTISSYQNSPAVGEPCRLALAFGVRRILRGELGFSTVERVLFVDRDFALRAFLLRVELHILTRMSDRHRLIEFRAVAEALVFIERPGSAQIRLVAGEASDR